MKARSSGQLTEFLLRPRLKDLKPLFLDWAFRSWRELLEKEKEDKIIAKAWAKSSILTKCWDPDFQRQAVRESNRLYPLTIPEDWKTTYSLEQIQAVLRSVGAEAEGSREELVVA